MKPSRPLSSREAVVHFFAFEYFQEGLIVVLANSISDLDSVDRSTHGFPKDGIPQAQDGVRVDLVGGYALQKVTNNRSYFRTIVNLDIKLAFVPPAFINFAARQIIGSGFKLYKKEVASVSKGDEGFSKVLRDPLYARIREALYSDDMPNGDAVPLDEETRINNDEKCPEPKVHTDDYVINLPKQEKNFEVTGKNTQGEIEEIEDDTFEKIDHLDMDDRKVSDSPVNQYVQKATENKNVGISPEVKQALETLEKAISIIREYRCNLEIGTGPNTTVKSVETEANSLKDSKSSEADKDHRNIGDSYEHRNSYGSHGSRRTSSSFCTSAEAHHNKIAPASQDVDAALPGEADHIAQCCSADQATAGTIKEKISKDDDVMAAHEHSIINEKMIGARKRKLPRYCCLYFLSGQFVA